MNLVLMAALLFQDKRIEQLLEKLRSDRVEERNDAAAQIRNLGEAAIPYLKKATKDKDGELSRQARDLLRDIQDPLHAETAEETFNRFRQRLENAKTISVKLRLESLGAGVDKSRFAGKPPALVLIKGDDKLWVDNFMDPGKEWTPHNSGIVSDGKRVAGVRGYAPKDLRADLMTGLCKAGIFLALYSGAARRMTTEKVVEGRVEESLTLSKIALAGNDSLGRKITYQLVHENENLDVTLWCDLKTRLPRKRIMSKSGGLVEKDQSYVESFEDWVLDGEIPDEKFKLSGAALAGADLATLRTALTAYEIDSGTYPTAAQGLDALIKKPARKPEPKNWKGPYLDAKEIPKDPWGRPYVYEFPGEKNPPSYDLLSAGPDGKAGTEDDVTR